MATSGAFRLGRSRHGVNELAERWWEVWATDRHAVGDFRDDGER